MNTVTKTLGLIIIATSIAGASAIATEITKRGPLPFTAIDTNSDGAISEEEFDDVRSKRQAARAAEGRQLRNAKNAPTFKSIDTDGDGKISKTEFTKGKALHTRKGHRGSGMAQGGGQESGMGRGHERGAGMGCGKGHGMGGHHMGGQHMGGKHMGGKHMGGKHMGGKNCQMNKQ